MRKLIGLLIVLSALSASAQTTRKLTRTEEAQGYFVLTIANGASVSDQIQLTPLCPAIKAIQMPGTWTAADISLLRSVGGTTYGTVYDEFGTQVVVKAVASAYIRLSLGDWAGTRYLQLRSATIGTPGTPVNQGGARLLTCECWR